MKFRAYMTDYNAMKEFANTMTSFSKVAEDCVIRILPDKIYFIVPEKDVPRRPFIWCEMAIAYYFKEYTMTGVSADCHEMYLSFSQVIFANCLSPARTNARSVKIKLTKKKAPCLTLEIDLVDHDASGRQRVVHDVPVDVIASKYWADYSEPRFQEFHVTLRMPSVKSVRNIVERMKQMSDYLIVSANEQGRATLRIETSMVTLSAHFPNLEVHSFAEDVPCSEDSQVTCIDANGAPVQLVTACVDIEKVMLFFTAMHVTSHRMMCSIVHGRMVKLVLDTPGVMTLQCFLTEITP